MLKLKHCGKLCRALMINTSLRRLDLLNTRTGDLGYLANALKASDKLATIPCFLSLTHTDTAQHHTRDAGAAQRARIQDVRPCNLASVERAGVADQNGALVLQPQRDCSDGRWIVCEGFVTQRARVALVGVLNVSIELKH